MKKHFNKFLVVLCMAACVFSLTACGSSDKEPIEYNEEAVQGLTEALVLNVITPMAESVDELKDLYEAEDMAEQLKENYMLDVDGSAFFTGLESWVSASKEIGGVADITEVKVSADNDQIMAEASITGTNNGQTAVMTFTFSRRGKMTSCSTNVNKSFGQLMENAALNTLLGMGTVFVVLILISFIISGFALIPKLEAKMKKKDTQSAPAAPAPAPAPVVETVDETDDLELIAVISAAVAAYEESNGGSGSGYFVRSIKRRY